MILGVGTDLVSVARIAGLTGRHRERFLARCFRLPVSDLPDSDTPGANLLLARHWALKEAFLKALGSEVRGIPYRDIEVSLPDHRSPRLDQAGASYRRSRPTKIRGN